MKVKTRAYGDDGYIKNEGPLSFFVSSALKPGNTFGQVERNGEKIENISAAFGNLIEVLADKGILNEKEVKYIIEDNTTEISFEPVHANKAINADKNRRA